ncbi:hypothetical protein [Actibacterium sp. MT2.3-13A]|uniref:hypothetical protein n=1 Tax=Actibacterium sp. MT2.3-13A TaxID=2828332 RepID=UPI001BA4BF84|nr:hypothetical protein [Actibacterium sp. MT2.3-13A]
MRVTLDNGTVWELSEESAVEVVNYPDRETPKEGWRRVREYPPLFIRTTNFPARILSKGMRVIGDGGGVVKVESIDDD